MFRLINNFLLFNSEDLNTWEPIRLIRLYGHILIQKSVFEPRRVGVVSFGLES